MIIEHLFYMISGFFSEYRHILVLSLFDDIDRLYNVIQTFSDCYIKPAKVSTHYTPPTLVNMDIQEHILFSYLLRMCCFKH